MSHLREQYRKRGLRRVDLAADPITQFERWWDEWIEADPYDAAACVLATADEDGRPAARYVLCRGVDDRGLVFYTNQHSAKARQLAVNPRAALVFGWLEVGRQVRIEGPVSQVDRGEADVYWATRPRGSQIAAWASDQSAALVDRRELDTQFADAVARFGGDPEGGPPIVRPPHWGGFRVAVERAEFWQGSTDRLHDRFVYRRSLSDPRTWVIDRLAP